MRDSTFVVVNDTRVETITVAALREMLDEFSDDMPVMFASNYGDMGRTMQTLRITDVEVLDVHESAYSDSRLALAERSIDDRDDDDRDDDELARVVVIHGGR